MGNITSYVTSSHNSNVKFVVDKLLEAREQKSKECEFESSHILDSILRDLQNDPNFDTTFVWKRSAIRLPSWYSNGKYIDQYKHHYVITFR